MRFIRLSRNNLAILLFFFFNGLIGQEFSTESPMRTGEVYKIAFPNTGIYALDYNFLKEELNIDVANIPTNSIHLFSHYGGALPQLISNRHKDGLQQFSLLYSDGGDQRLDPGDQIIFFAQGASIWEYDEQDMVHHKTMNPYDHYNYGFIVINSNLPAKTVMEKDYLNEATTFVTAQGTKSQRFEEEKVNLLFPYFATQGSGLRWFGDRFKGGGDKDYSEHFDMQNVPINAQMKLFANFAARSEVSTSYSISVNDQTFHKSLAKTNVSDVEASYAKDGILKQESTIKDVDFIVKLDYPGGGASSDGWLDFIEIHADQNLVFENDPLRIINYHSTAYAYSKLRIKSNNDQVVVWDVSIPWESIHLQATQTNGFLEFVTPSNLLRTFYAFDPGQRLAKPIAIGKTKNQNLHKLSRADMLVVYHPDFETAVQRYVTHRSQFSNLVVEAVNIQEVYNEFSSGRVDPTAIRDLARMLNQRDPQFRYLLLFGDATFDYRNIYEEIDDHNFVPTYQTYQSFDPIEAFPSDDYFGLLSDWDGRPNLRGALDISVGRFPVKTLDEALKIVDKIMHYELSPEVFGNWKLKAGFVADDEDGSMHLDQAEGIARSFNNDNLEYNIEKIYFDGFKQVATPGGERYPEVNASINKLFNEGAMVINYMGHGGPKGWADEKVLELQDIESWNNYDRLPLCVTATCTFSGYDDPTNVSPGELTFLNNKGGVIALFSTVRAVYSGSNRRLAQSVFNNITKPVNGAMPTLGEILQNAKNSSAADTLGQSNARKFLLIGDPALKLKYPELDIQTTSIKDFLTELEIDTLRALQKVVFEGEIVDQGGNLMSDFNGTLYPTLFDKPAKVKTLQQNIGSQLREFNIQKNVLFNGSVSVIEGKFSFSFTLPKDINYTYGIGKMSFYATDLITDASGWSSDFVIGGSANNNLQDDLGPVIKIYLEDRSFEAGDVVNNNPQMIIDLEDESGINVTGNSIGHDLTATINLDSRNTIILNEYYQSVTDDITKGSAEYELSNLEPGRHSLTIKAWDIANNSSEATVEFEIEDRPPDIQKVQIIPNPVSNGARIYFEHGLTNQELNVQVEVYSTLGNLVSTFESNTFSDGGLAGPIEWRTTNESGTPLVAGVYYVRVLATPARGKNIELESTISKVLLIGERP